MLRLPRRLGAVLVAAILLLPSPPEARGQEQTPSVTLRLVAQSAWNGPRRPLRLAVAATNNTGVPLERLSLVVSIGTPTRSRSAYELSLTQDQTAFPFALPFPFQGALGPGQTRVFSIRQRLGVLAERGESALYPVKVQLLSGDEPRDTLRTPMVFLAEPPETPLHIVWTWVLSEPLQHLPDGSMLPGTLPSTIAPGGWLDAAIRALDEITPGSVTVAVSPVLVEELGMMADGYRVAFPDGTRQRVRADSPAAADAGRLLDTLRRLAGRPRTELVALPAGDALVPSVVASGLGRHVRSLLVEGRHTVESALGARPSPLVFHPPRSQVDDRSASLLGRLGVEALLLDAGAVEPEPSLPFSPPPIVRLADASPSPWAVAPDPGVERVVHALSHDPRLAAQAALGELAATWLEFPGTPGRAAVVSFSASSPYPPAFFAAFVDLVRASPWLIPTTTSRMLTAVTEPVDVALAPRRFRRIAPSYVQRFLEVRERLRVFRATVREADDLSQQLHGNLLAALGGAAVTQPEVATRFVDQVAARIKGTYGEVRPPPWGSIVTLTSQGGSLPFTVANAGPYPMRVVVRFVADRRLVFPSGSVRELTLPQRQISLIRVPVRALATGRFPIKVEIQTPSPGVAPHTIAETEVIIRSTAYNRVALVVTVGAALFLMAWWSRRFLRRRAS